MRTVLPITVVVQVLAFFASVIPADILGATGDTDAYYLAFSVPLVAAAIGLSAIQLGAIPALSDADAPNHHVSDPLGQPVSELISIAVWMSLFVAAATTGLALLLLPQLGRSVSGHTVTLARQMVIELAPLAPLAVVSGTLSAALNVRGRYALPVAVLMLDPIARIVCTLVGANSLGVRALVLGNVIAACISPLVLLWAVRRQDIHVRLTFPRWTPLLTRVVRLAGPLVFASTILLANPVVDRAMVTTLGAGSVTQLELGLRIYGVPFTLFVSALIGPMTARWRQVVRNEGLAAIERPMRQIIGILVMAAIPLALMILVLRREIVMGILQGGSYDTADVRGTAAVLGALILGLPAQIAIAMLTVAFIASEKVMVPVAFAIANVTLNCLLDVLLRGPLGIAGIALSTTITLTLLMLAEVVVFQRLIGNLRLKELGLSLLKVTALFPLLYGLVELIRQAMPYAYNRPTALLVSVAGLLAGTLFYLSALALLVPRPVARRSLRHARTAIFGA